MICNICLAKYRSLKKCTKCNFSFCNNCLYKYVIKYNKKICPQCKDNDSISDYIESYKLYESKLNFIKKIIFILLFPILYLFFIYFIGNYILLKRYKINASIYFSILYGFFLQILSVIFIFATGLIFPVFANYFLNKITND